MEYNYEKIRDEVRAMVREACYAPDNYFGPTTWNYHIESVVEHCLDLGKKLEADLEVLELAALLHDYASLLGKKELYKEHHKYGAEKAEEILTKLNYPDDKIEKVKNCIFSHRGSIKEEKNSLEEKILASADAMSHITELADMFYLTYGIHKYDTQEGAKWLKAKLDRSWEKIALPEGKKTVWDDYNIAIKILTKAINKNTDAVQFAYVMNLCFIFNDQGELLLQNKTQGFGAGKWNGPGGKVSKGETVEESTLREVKEEVNININKLEPRGALEFVFKEQPEWNNVCHIFSASDWSGEPKDSERRKNKWFKPADVPLDKMWDDDKYWLPRLLQGKNVYMRFYFDKNGKVEKYLDMENNIEQVVEAIK